MFEGFGSTDTPATKPTPECPGCGEPDLAGDDFCHECGHSFEHLGAAQTVDGDDDESGGEPCPVCSGTVVALEYGRRQCDLCGYTARDDG